MVATDITVLMGVSWPMVRLYKEFRILILIQTFITLECLLQVL